MNQITTISASVSENKAWISRKFLPVLFREKTNRIYLWIALAGITVQFVVFKMLYPFPDFISDSYSYIATAALHMDVNLWPVGYSKFLGLFHLLTHSDTALVCCQYLMLEAALLYFFFTVVFLYQPARTTCNILFAFLIFNPIFLYLSNCILSDALFTALTLLWFSQMLRMIHRPRRVHFFTLAILIGLLFTIRYTAIYYPFISAVAFALSRQRVWVKLAGSLAPLLFIIPFVLFTEQKTKAITGTAEFSVFGGWQLANNALYMYGHINVESSKLPAATRPLDRMVKQYFKKVNPQDEDFAAMPGTYFIKVSYAPLKQYMFRRYSFNDEPGQFRAWGMVSPVYHAYGIYLITHYPLSFIRHYLLHNTKNYFIPHLEKFGSYNLMQNTVPAIVQDWFDYITPDVRVVSQTAQGKLFYVYPSIFMVLNIYFAGSMIWLLFSGRFRTLDLPFKKALLLVGSFLLLNFGFSVLPTPVVLRYQVVPMTLLFAISLLLFELENKPKETINVK